MSKKTQYAVQINSKEEFDQLMEYYDKIGWKRCDDYTLGKKYPFCITFNDNYEASYKIFLDYRGLFSFITLTQAKKKIRHMKAYKKWSEKQKLELEVTPQEGGTEYSKIKPGDKVWVELAVSKIEHKWVTAHDFIGNEYVLIVDEIKKHIPVKSELEEAEEELEKIHAIDNEMRKGKGVPPILDSYYQARKKVEELKNQTN
jgi:hypothetical protein